MTKDRVKQLKWKIKIFQKNSLSSKAVTVMLMERLNLTFEVTSSHFLRVPLTYKTCFILQIISKVEDRKIFIAKFLVFAQKVFFKPPNMPESN